MIVNVPATRLTHLVYLSAIVTVRSSHTWLIVLTVIGSFFGMLEYMRIARVSPFSIEEIAALT